MALAVALGLALVAVSPIARARTQRVHSRAQDLPVAVLTRLCRRGMVALIENTPEGTSRQVVLFGWTPSPPAKVYDVLMDVERYPEFLNTVDRAHVTRRAEHRLAFRWSMDIPFLGLSGTRQQRGVPGRWVETRGRTGHLRGSHERWELHPSDRGTLIAFYRSLDLETGGFLLRNLVDLEPSMEAGANLSSGFVHLVGVQRRLAGMPPQRNLPKARSGPVPPLAALDLEDEVPLPAVQPLLRHGLLAFIESYPDGALKQVALLGSARVSAAKYRRVVENAEAYPKFMPNITKQQVTRRPDGSLDLAWTIETPVSSMSGVARMQSHEDRIEVVALSGDVARARLQWRFRPVGDGAVVPIYYAYNDIRAASWATRMLLDAEPLLEHGMVAAAATVAMTAMTARAEGRR